MTIKTRPASDLYRNGWDSTFHPDEVGVVYHDQIPREYQVPLTVPDEERARVKPLVKVTEVTGWWDQDCETSFWSDGDLTSLGVSDVNPVEPNVRGRYRITVEFWPEGAK